jgi:glycerate kinase
VAELNQLEHKIAHADWVITGEGKFDQQTLSCKAQTTSSTRTCFISFVET